MLSMPTTLPGAIDNACAAIKPRCGTRCRIALTVVSTINGLSLPFNRDNFASVVTRWATMAPCGETRS